MACSSVVGAGAFNLNLGGYCSSWSWAWQLREERRHQRSSASLTSTTRGSHSVRTLKMSSSSSSLMGTTIRERERERRRVVPWLFLSAWTTSPPEEKSHYLYDFVQEKIITQPQHPQASSSHSKTHPKKSMPSIPSPVPTSSFPNWTATLRNFTTDRITHYVEDDDDEPKIELYLYQDKVNGMGKGSSFLFQRIDPTTAIDVADLYRQDYYRKAILSPSLDYVVVIYGLDPDEQKLAIAQVGQTTTTPPSSWTPLHHKSSRFFVDIIFHQGRLHALDSDCALTIFDSIQNPLAPSLFCPPAVNPIPLKGNEKKVDRRMEMYLVESPNGHDLFLVYRIFKPVEADLQPVTKTFKVYKLDKSNECCYKWEPVETIGDLAFFVGYNHSISLSSRDFPPNLLKPNSIYFTDTYYFNYRIGDNGVFHLEDGTLHFYQINDAIHKLYKMQPIWLMPRSACSF